MKVFVSSLISGFGPLRDAASAATRTLGHVPVRAEDFSASPDSPQTACLAGVRDADLVVLILGERYGQAQSSGLSATHEEYREARNARPVLVFIQSGITPEPAQAAFIAEVQGWETGHYTAPFVSADDLRDHVTRGVHDFSLAYEAAPLNEAELVSSAQELLSGRARTSRASLLVAVAAGPTRAVLRPAELEADDLRQFLLREALTGDLAVLSVSAGTDTRLKGDAVELRQQQADRLVRLDEGGRVLIAQPAQGDDRRTSVLPSIIEEDIAAALERALRFAGLVLDHIDAPNRLTHVSPVASIIGGGYLPWRTRKEQQRSPNSASIGMSSHDEVTVNLMPAVRRRPALAHEAHRLAEDLTVRLRRDFRR